jgi:hypothetical protein
MHPRPNTERAFQDLPPLELLSELEHFREFQPLRQYLTPRSSRNRLIGARGA